jgi:Peptidase_C39 like family
LRLPAARETMRGRMPESFRTALDRLGDASGWERGESELVSPETPTAFGFTEAIVSWNASAPPGSAVETGLRARVGSGWSGWSGWYTLGSWSEDAATRHSVGGQADEDGRVDVDTVVLARRATAYQVRLRLHGAAAVRGVAVATSTTPRRPAAHPPGEPSLWGTVLDVPACSQMVYPDGGEVWCSPTSVAMVLGFHGALPGACETRVRHAVAGVFDPVYDGHGNWPFNTAYAARHGVDAAVARLESLAALEPWIAAGLPVVISYAWREGELDGAPVASTDGHLGVLVGFDADGRPVVNDPAAAADDEVRRTYDRAQLESRWLERSGGACYLIVPRGTEAPPPFGPG